MNLRGGAGLILLVLAAAGSWMLFRMAGQERPEKTAQTDQPGYYLEQAEIRGIGDDGELLYRVQASRITHDPADDSVDLTDVNLKYAEDRQPDWIVTAQRGRITGRGETIDLRGNVRLTGTDTGDRPMVISTNTLSFEPRERIARTADPVKIEQQGFELNAVGMEADLNLELLRLKSEISGTFYP